MCKDKQTMRKWYMAKYKDDDNNVVPNQDFDARHTRDRIYFTHSYVLIMSSVFEQQSRKMRVCTSARKQ